MTKRIILATLAVFALWSALDFVIHGLILGETYKATAQIWRPMAEMKMGLIRIVTLISAVVFVCIYAGFVSNKTVCRAIQYGVLFGIGAGVSMGYGTYAVLPMPYKIALVWFLGTVVETALGGWVLGLIVKT